MIVLFIVSLVTYKLVSVHREKQLALNGDYIIGYVSSKSCYSNPFTGEPYITLTLQIDSMSDGVILPCYVTYDVSFSIYHSYEKGDIVYFDEVNTPIFEVNYD